MNTHHHYSPHTPSLCSTHNVIHISTMHYDPPSQPCTPCTPMKSGSFHQSEAFSHVLETFQQGLEKRANLQLGKGLQYII